MEHTVTSTFLCLPLVSNIVSTMHIKINLENSTFSIHSTSLYTTELMRGLKKVKDHVGPSGLSPPKETTAERGWFDEFSYETNASYGAPGFRRPKDLCWWAELSSSRKGPVQTSPGDALSFLQLHLVIQEQALVHGLMLVATVGRSIDWRERLSWGCSKRHAGAPPPQGRSREIYREGI